MKKSKTYNFRWQCKACGRSDVSYFTSGEMVPTVARDATRVRHEKKSPACKSVPEITHIPRQVSKLELRRVA